MAKLTQPLGSSEARGKLGGYVYNTWRGIAYVKAKATPGNQNTPRRLALRALAKACTTRWQAITDGQRAQWNYFAASTPDVHWTGNPKRLSGYNWFIRTNVRLLDIGLSILDTPPYRPLPWPLATLAASVISDEITITWTLPPGPVASQLTTDIWYTAAQSAGRQPKLEDAKHKAYVASEAGTHTTPALATGTYGIFARTIDELTGLASPWLLVTATIAPGAAETAGPNFPAAYEDFQTVLPYWIDPANLFANDDAYAENDADPGPDSDVLLLTDWGFAIPLTATIVGITAVTEAAAFDANDIKLRLWVDGEALGDTKVQTVTPNGAAVYTFGGPADDWNASPTPAILNLSTNGIIVWTTVAFASTTLFDYLTLEVDYTT